MKEIKIINIVRLLCYFISLVICIDAMNEENWVFYMIVAVLYLILAQLLKPQKP